MQGCPNPGQQETEMMGISRGPKTPEGMPQLKQEGAIIGKEMDTGDERTTTTLTYRIKGNLFDLNCFKDIAIIPHVC